MVTFKLMWRAITLKDTKKFNNLVSHPLQSYEWGAFREKTGIQVIRRGWEEKGKLIQAFQLTIHPIPHTSWTIGYLPKGTLPTEKLIDELKKIGKENNCIFIQLEPNVVRHSEEAQSADARMIGLGLIPAAHPLFTKYTLQIDLTKTNDELLKSMHPKARYNIKVAQKHGVVVAEEHTQEAFEIFWQLTKETTSRQQFFAHTKQYHQDQWAILPHASQEDTLSSHLLFAKYQGKPLTAWILFVFKDMLYYPYGASSQEHRETMHSTLMMWEAIQFGKKHHLKSLDLWGAAEPNAKPSDPWVGFTQFKERFGPTRIEFVGSYDLVINPILYEGYKIADKLRWILLRLKR